MVAATARARARAGRAGAPPRPAPGRAGLSLVGLATVAAIVAVVVLVSLSRLRGLVVHENERDAVQAATLVAERLSPHEATTPTVQTVVAEGDLERRLTDAEFLADGRLMRRHGYLFEVVRLPAPAPEDGVRAASAAEALAVRAWPCAPGESGALCLVATADGRVLGHPDAGRLCGAPDPAPPKLPHASRAWLRLGWRSLPAADRSPGW